MLRWFTDWCERRRRVRRDADEIVRFYGDQAYTEAYRRASRGADEGRRDRHWDGVRREIGRRDFAEAARHLPLI